ITVSEGVNREVRRIFAALGHEVKRLLRVQVGPLTLTGMKRGATRPLAPGELVLLKREMAGKPGEAEETVLGRPTRRFRRRMPAPRLGKPDPAAGKKHIRGELVVDEWEKKSGPRRIDGRKKAGRERERHNSEFSGAERKTSAAGRKGRGGMEPRKKRFRSRPPAIPPHPLAPPSSGPAKGRRHG
ncbi:MAG: hypothetical protein LBE84_05475, partial [Planctomycetota bacterium]|nr:hypothetical protein [Planctomycetota bacterium]